MATKQVFQKTIWWEIEYEHIDAWVDYTNETFAENMDSLVEALNQNSKSSTFLAWVGIVIAIIGAGMTGVGAWYTYLSYIK